MVSRIFAPKSNARCAFFLLLVAVAYFVTGRLGLTLAYYNRMATLLWAPSGIAVAALWLGGRRMWIGVALGAFATNLSIGATPLLALVIALGNTGEALVADALVERARLRPGLRSVRDVVLFVGLVVGASTLVAALNAALWLPLFTGLPINRLLPTTLTWWLGDAGGVLVVTPLLLSIAHPRVQSSARATEGVLLAVLAPAIASISFGLVLPAAVSSASLALLPFPLLIWAALRFGMRGATAATAIVTVAAVLGTVAGTGPFRSGNPHADVASLWSLLAALSISAMLLAVSLEEREREVETRRDRERWLGVAVDASHAVAIERDLPGGRVRVFHDDGEPSTEWIDAAAWRARIHEADRNAVDEAIASCEREGADGWHCEYRTSTNGDTRRMSERVRIVLRDASGRPIRAVGLCADITDRHRAEQQRLALQQELEGSKRLTELGLLAGGIAHDFNNLLMVVRANAELARVGDARFTADALTAIDTATVRAAELTDQLLAYAGRRPMKPRDVDLGALATETVRMLGAGLPSRIAFKIDADRSANLVEGDPSQLRQVLMNLALNAVQAIDGEGRVSIRVAPDHTADEPTVVLEVRDNGRGMDEETLSRVFQPFFTTKEHGRGLGMAAVLGIVRSHNGRLTMDSQPRVGTTISVRLPATDRLPRAVELDTRTTPVARVAQE
jgi:two-component system cell cycle sensor histidine kinase/response regulator CckA